MKKVFLNLILVLFFSQCALTENLQKTEAKDYQDQIHHVDQVDYEFEERLNSFYESEPIENQDLYNLYNGEFPEGERNPKNLRIHWKDARELALAELELQTPIQKSWQNAEISERPILILDKDGGDFYRYYEYRVIKNNRLLGAIRIPAYRRTENFATTEVHYYSHDEKTYTIQPTGWGQYMAENSDLDILSDFIKNIEYSSNINKNFIYKILLEYLLKEMELSTKSQADIPNNVIDESLNTMIVAFEIGNEAISELKSRNKGKELPNSIHNKAKEYYKRENASKYKEGLKKYAQIMAKYDIIIELMNNPELDTINKANLDEFFRTTYLEFIRSYFKLMSSSTQQDVIVKMLTEFYWQNVENLSYDKDQILIQKYSVDKIFKDNHISPYVISKPFEQTQFLQEQNIVDLLLTIIPQKIGFTIDNQNYTIMTFIPPTDNVRTTDRDQALEFLKNELDEIGQNINDAIDKDNTSEVNDALSKISKYIENILADSLDPSNGNGEPNKAAKWLAEIIDNLFLDLIIDTNLKGVLTSLLKNFDLMDSFIDNIAPIATGCVKLNTVNNYLQKNGIEKLSEKDGKDIWFLERMCAILKKSVDNLKDFDPNKPIESLVKLVGPILKEYMESIYYAMSRSCDRWNIPPVLDLSGSLGSINEILNRFGSINIGEITIKISDIYHINTEGTLGALHHSWWNGHINPKFNPIKTSFISTRGAFCYWRYAWPKSYYKKPTYTDW
ncbi:MAG: hypothetical protein ACRCTJ_06615 [Brevinema sp.]